jgi:transposase
MYEVWQTWGMKTISLDLRERILAAYDADEGTRAVVAHRFRVSLGMVKKLLQQRRRLGDIRPQHHRSGCKPRIVASHQHQLRTLLDKKPDLTLKELRAATGLACTLPAIHYVLIRLGLTYKKRRSGLVNKTGPTSSGHGGLGGGSRPALIRRGWSSSTNRARKPI